MKSYLAVLLGTTLSVLSSLAQAQQTVVLVRHAELMGGQAMAEPKHVPLSEAGEARAQRLASFLKDSGISAIYVTDFVRTNKTAEPLSRELKMAPTVLPKGDPAVLVERLRDQHGGGTVLLVILHAGLAMGQSFPARPLRLVVGFTPGGGVDINARLLAAMLTGLLGQQVIVENKPGAGTNIANEYVAKSVPDGYTLLFNSSAFAINLALYQNPPYALRDFAGVSVFSESTNLLVVSASLPARSLPEVVALARTHPGALNYSSAGAGTSQHLAGELFKLRTGTDIVHVPYKGSAPALTALVAGEVQMSFSNTVAINQHVRSGRLRALAVAGAKRTVLMPEVPTMKEAGVEGVEVPLWFGLLAPAATPREIVRTLSAAVAKAASSSDLRKHLLEQGADPVGNTPEEFDRQLREEVARWAEVVKVSGARAD